MSCLFSLQDFLEFYCFYLTANKNELFVLASGFFGCVLVVQQTELFRVL